MLLLLTKIALVNNSRDSSRVGSGLNIFKPQTLALFCGRELCCFKLDTINKIIVLYKRNFPKRPQICQFYCYHPSPPLVNPFICTNFKFGPQCPIKLCRLRVRSFPPYWQKQGILETIIKTISLNPTLYTWFSPFF